MTKENALQKQKREAENNFANAPLKKKISFFSSIIIVIGAVMGAGMFFKAKTVLDNSQGSILFSVFSWLLTVVAVILMALALIEIASARNDNLSIIGWCQTFNSRVVYKACKNFMSYLYIPLTYFFLPLYFIQSIQDGVAAVAGGSATIGPASVDWLIVTIITIAVSSYFIVVCGFSSRIGNIQNYVITAFNFVPVFIAIIVSFIGVAQIGGIAGGQAGLDNNLISQIKFDPIQFVPSSTANLDKLYTFQMMSPGFGLFIGVGAIFFAYDGFYVTAGIQSEMKEPKKTPYALLYGLLAITVVYLLVAIAMSLGSTDGAPSGMKWIFEKNNIMPLYAVFQILIGVGVLSILNGFGLWSSRFYEDLIKANELPFSTKFINKLNQHRPRVGIAYSLVITLPIIFIFCTIGGLAYVNSGDYDSVVFGANLTRMYSFGDLMGTWASVGAFTFILLPIFGALRNRRTNDVYVEKTKVLIPSGIGCIIIMVPAIFITYFAPIADVLLLFRIPTTNTPNYNYLIDILIPRIMLVIVLILYIAGSFLPTNIEDYFLTKKYGSIQNGEGAKLEAIAKTTNQPLNTVIFNTLEQTKRWKLNDWEKNVLGRDELTDTEIQKIIAKEHQ